MRECSRCGEQAGSGSVITIPAFEGEPTEIFYCSKCEEDKRGKVWECDTCGDVAIIISQDPCFNHKECERCYDKRVAHLKYCQELYKDWEIKHH